MKILIFSLSTFILSTVSLDNNVTVSLRALSTSCDATVLNNYCYGSLNLNAEGIWVSWDTSKTSPPENAVEGGADTGGTYYVSRSQYGSNGIIPGKYSPSRKYAWFSYGGVELGSTQFDVLRHTNVWWGEMTDDATKWIPAGIDAAGNVIYICQAQVPASINANQYTVPGKYHLGRCYIPFNGQEIGLNSGFKVLRQSLR
ncbi:uncharacterized protein LOC119066705 [Bradysia coprophila]|uniref:uncharacterized protein LOC119066705 n=1 Tax=Bradysia coprophila TaxID=38358 RepID=UPI00187DCA86|nr:uncharacterized protein LOC119066705 [Bradysia coprophila]